MRSRPLPRAFRSGELAPWLDGITNEITQQGCRTLENFIVRKQGQATRRPGTFFVNEVKDSADATVLVPVTIDDDSSYVLELGDEYIRFYKNHARITYTGTTTIYEVTSPWSTGDVSDLRWCYVPNEKALYFSHPSYPMERLTWVADADWEIETRRFIASEKYVYIDEQGTALSSPDLQNWSEKRLPFEDGRVARGKESWVIQSSTTFYVSNDAETWVPINTGIAGEHSVFGKSIVGNKNGTFVACGNSTAEHIYSLDDGLTWKDCLPAPSLAHLCVGFDEILGNYRFGGPSINRDAVSSNGIYIFSMALGGAGDLRSIHGYNDFWVGVGAGSIKAALSITASWTVALSMGSTAWVFRDVARSPGDLWVAVGSHAVTGSLLLYRSDGGLVWSTADTSGIAQPIEDQRPRALSWIHSRFLFHTSTRYGNYAESDDGITWTSVTVGARIYAKASDSVVDDDIDYEWFNSSGHYPGQVAFHEGRLVIGPTDVNPATLWASKTGEYGYFHLDELSNDAWSYELASERNVDIQWMMGNLGGLVVGTRTAEGIMLGSQEEGITPNTAQFRWLSTFGSANVHPIRVNNSILFVQRGGEIVRGYVPQANAFESPELTYFADHIGKGGLLSIDRQEDPQNIAYFVRSDGQMPALSMEKGLVAWSRIKPASTSLSVGIVESVAVIPTAGAEDEVWQVVNRKVTAGTIRCIEYYDQLAVSSLADAHYVDCGVNETSGTTFATVGGLTHLAGEVIDALIDGTRWVSGLTVAASGTIALAPYSGTNVHAGLPYSSYLQTMRGDYGSPWGDGAGLHKRTDELLVWVHDSSALASFGPTTTLATETIVYPSSTTLVTDIVKVNFPGQWDRENYLWCIITDPRPFTLVAMMPDSETGDR